MKCPADIVLACDNQPECSRCGFCMEHCICSYLDSLEFEEWSFDESQKL